MSSDAQTHTKHPFERQPGKSSNLWGDFQLQPIHNHFNSTSSLWFPIPQRFLRINSRKWGPKTKMQLDKKCLSHKARIPQQWLAKGDEAKTHKPIPTSERAQGQFRPIRQLQKDEIHRPKTATRKIEATAIGSRQCRKNPRRLRAIPEQLPGSFWIGRAGGKKAGRFDQAATKARASRRHLGFSCPSD